LGEQSVSASISTETRRFYEFGPFRLDPSEKTLFCDDKPLPLRPKIFDTLQYLVEHPGRLLDKDELMQGIWQDRAVEESNLTFNIKTLRRALNDDPNQPRFIETVRGRGYRFIADVKEVSLPRAAAQVESHQTAPEKVPAMPRGRSYLSVTVVSAVLLVLLAGGWFVRNRPTTSTRSAPILSRPFESEKFFSSGGFVHAVITPDGKYVAYTSETGGKQSVWLRQLETAENIQIVPPVAEEYRRLAISPDGNSLYFVRSHHPEASGTIYRVATFGGIPMSIARDTVNAMSVSRDNGQISFIRCKLADDDFCSLYVVGSDGKNERKVLTRKRPFRIGANQFSPDGKSIAFAAGHSWNGGSDFRLMQLDLASGVENEIPARTFFEISSLTWLPDQSGMLLTAKESLDGTSRIWQVSTATADVRALTKDATDYIDLSLDNAVNKMVARNLTNTFHLYVARMEDLQNPKNLAVARTGFALAPGGKIVYEGNDGDIWTINADGGEQRQLTNNSFRDFSPTTSPDGRFVFFTSNRTGSNQVWRMNSDGSDAIQISKTEGGYPRFVSPDGKWVYFESGLHQTLWRVSTGGSEETEVFGEKVSEPSFSADGRFFSYFVREGGNDAPGFTLAVISLDDRRNVKNFKLAATGSEPSPIAWVTAWASDNKSVYYITTTGARNFLWRQSLDEKNPHLLGELGDEQVAHFAVTPDGAGAVFIRGRWIHSAVMIKGLR
jgi:Tol biopolymer transport system component/DNA-binding winged helix-turn-helix (wHTH) protein